MEDIRKVNINRQSNMNEQSYSAPAPRRRGFGAFLGIIIILLIIIGGGYAVMKMGVFGSGSDEATSPSGYQAVFLINGQVYFGRLASQGSQFPVLTDVYYLQVSQPLQPVEEGAPAANPDISLVKLGGELHGPTDEMKINRDQILLIEDLKTDSNVVRAIAEYKKSAAAAPATAPATQ